MYSFCISEVDAKTKWCPMARQLGTLIGRRDETEDDRTVAMGSQNRGYVMGRALDNCLCLASGCMMWRWVETSVNDGKGSEMVPSYNTHGYCGVAGQPWAPQT